MASIAVSRQYGTGTNEESQSSSTSGFLSPTHFTPEEYRLLREARDTHDDIHLEANISDSMNEEIDDAEDLGGFDASNLREMRALTAATRKAVTNLTRGQERTSLLVQGSHDCFLCVDVESSQSRWSIGGVHGQSYAKGGGAGCYHNV